MVEPAVVLGTRSLPSASGHPHASDEARLIAERGTVLRAQVGSGVHGTSLSGQDDRDELGLCLEPPAFVTGVARVPAGLSRPRTVAFEQFHAGSAEPPLHVTDPQSGGRGPGAVG